VKVNAVWLSRIVGAAGVTSRFTVTVALVVPLDTLIAPVWTPGKSPAGFAVTCTLAVAATDAEPLEGEIEIHGLAGSPWAVQPSAPPPALLIVTDCDCAAAPCWIWKFSAAGATARLADAVVTLRVTLTVSSKGDARGFEIVMLVA
jgi:hypothetical protein